MPDNLFIRWNSTFSFLDIENPRLRKFLTQFDGIGVHKKKRNKDIVRKHYNTSLISIIQCNNLLKVGRF